MIDALAALREEIAVAGADRDVAQTVYAALASNGERLQAAISEHRSKAAELAGSGDDDQYGERLTALTALQREIDGLRAICNISEFHDARRSLGAANARLADLVAEYEGQCWAALPAAAAHLFEQAEESRRDYELALGRIDSVAMTAHELAHRQTNGTDPRLTPAWRAYLKLSEMAAILASSLGSGAVRDFRTGPELIAAVHDGSAVLGDISRWTPSFRGAPDGTQHIARPQTPQEAPPDVPSPEADPRAHAPPQGPASDIWPFRPEQPSDEPAQ